MDANKKYLFFNIRDNDENFSRSFPVSALVAMDTDTTSTSSTKIKLLFKEAVQTDTTDVFLERTTDGADPRDFMEALVNEINFGKDATIVVGDDRTKEYLHKDISSVDSISAATYTNPTITLGSRVQSTITSANAAGTGAPERSSNVGEVNSEIITTFFIDLATVSTTSTSSATPDEAIGVTGGGAAYITQITEAVNGVVYAAELICVETPAGGATGVGLSSSVSATAEQGDDATGTEQITDTAQQKGDRTQINFVNPTANPVHSSGIPDNRYLYLYHDGSGAGDYTAGKFVLRLYGAKTTGL